MRWSVRVTIRDEVGWRLDGGGGMGDGGDHVERFLSDLVIEEVGEVKCQQVSDKSLLSIIAFKR